MDLHTTQCQIDECRLYPVAATEAPALAPVAAPAAALPRAAEDLAGQGDALEAGDGVAGQVERHVLEHLRWQRGARAECRGG